MGQLSTPSYRKAEKEARVPGDRQRPSSRAGSRFSAPAPEPRTRRVTASDGAGQVPGCRMLAMPPRAVRVPPPTPICATGTTTVPDVVIDVSLVHVTSPAAVGADPLGPWRRALRAEIDITS